jgi:L-seryl-tRNA(Ser) seleniumtransferase
LLSLLATSTANLQNRAERLAPQLAASPLVSSAVAKCCTASLRGLSLPGQELPSWCVEVKPASGNVEQLVQRLQAAAPCVVGRVVEDRLRLDLRSVFPRQDMQLAAAFGIAETPSEEELPTSEPIDPATTSTTDA